MSPDEEEKQTEPATEEAPAEDAPVEPAEAAAPEESAEAAAETPPVAEAPAVAEASATEETPATAATPAGDSAPSAAAPTESRPRSDSRRDDDDRGRDDDDRGGRRRFYGRRKVCTFCVESATSIDYKDPAKLRRFVSDRGRIEARRRTGTCAKHQRWLAVALKRARHIALLPYAPEHIRITGAFASRR